MVCKRRHPSRCSKHSRSAVIERALRRYLRDSKRAEPQRRDLERINQASEQLNVEAADVLDYLAAMELRSGAHLKRDVL